MNANAVELDRGIRGLESAIEILRKYAQAVGPLHGYWDTIFDLEELLKLLKSTSRS